MEQADLGEMNLSGLSPAAREQVAFLLRAHGVHYDARHETVSFPPNLRFVVQGAVDEASATSVVAKGLAQRRRRREVDTPVLASRTKRVIAGVIDSVLIAIVSAGLLAVLTNVDNWGRWWLAFVVAEWAVVVVPMAMTGRPPGARAAGTVVVAHGDLDVPGWSASTVRWVVAQAPVFVVGVLGFVGFPSSWAFVLWLGQTLALMAIYLGVFVHPLAQGLHDRAAHTIVITHR